MSALPHAVQTSAVYMLRNSENPPVTAFINDPLHSFNVGNIGGDDGITGLDGVPPREAAAVLPEYHGGVHGNFWMDRRPYTATVELVSPTIDARNLALERLRRASKGYLANSFLYWFPGDPSIVPVTRINGVKNPSFESDAISAAPFGWTNSTDAQWTSPTFQVQAVNPLVGANALRLTGTKDNTATARQIGAYTDVAVEGGGVYSTAASIFVNNAIVSGTDWALQVQWFDANNTSLGSVVGSSIAGAGRQTMTVPNITAPAYAAYARLFVVAISTSALDVVDAMIDAVQFVQEPAVGSFFTGDTANCTWLGTAGQGASVNRPFGRYVAGRLQQAPRQSGIGWKKGHLTAWIANDPCIYSAQEYQIAALAPAATQSIENRGDEEGLPSLIQINGPGVNPVVNITANGVTRKYAFAVTLAGGDSIVILPRTRSVSKNGAPAAGILDLSNTSWPGVMPGTNTIQTTFSSGSTGASTTKINWQDAWA